ncbi:MAG: HDIG domain-containing protein, partial [Candidatus Omnitrophica bacterium]|nr:HDIG domain-containing protein [Candidatus Omnitrophota bacterium]
MKKILQWRKTKTRALYIAVRIGLGLIIAGSTISTVYIGRKIYGEGLKEGDVSLRTIYAPIDFKYRVGIDEEKTEAQRKQAKEAVDQVYEIEQKTTQDIVDSIQKFFAQITTVQNLKDLKEEERLKEAQGVIEIKLSEQDLKTFLFEGNTEDTKSKTIALLKELLLQGIIGEQLEKKLTNPARNYILLSNSLAETETKIPIDKILTLSQVKKDLTGKTQNLLPENRKLRVAVINLIQQILRANVQFNESLTEQRRKQAYDNAPIQYKEREIKKEELIIARGERVGKEHLLKIKQMFHLQEKVNRFMFFSGAAILALLFLSIITMYLKSYEPKIFTNTRKLILIGTLFVLILGLAKMITYSPLPSYTIPTAIASILIAILVGPRPAIIITLSLSIFVGIIAGDKLNVSTVCFVGGIVGIFFIQGARRRSQILIAGCLVGVANFVSICALELLHGLKYAILFKEGFWGIINGLASGIIITGILPVFEFLFKMVTSISLLELSDLNHPLLKEMVLKAPGTYHHSLIVGNLAEAASEAIGANALLARVGSYFHDIGKTEKAEYFSENQTGATKRKHDKLTPSMSSLIITNHVKDGGELANKYKLNQAIIDFIEQ